MRALQPRERRLVALGLLVVALAATWFAVVSPIAAGFQDREARRQALLRQLRADQRLLKSVPVLRQAARDQQGTASLYAIGAPSEAEAAGLLKQRLTTALTAAGGAVEAAQPVQVNVPRGWVSIRVDAVINLTQLTTTLRHLQNEAPYVVVEYASLGADRAARSGRAAPLDVRLQISAPVRIAPPR